jgi:hypothetical protein
MKIDFDTIFPWFLMVASALLVIPIIILVWGGLFFLMLEILFE